MTGHRPSVGIQEEVLIFWLMKHYTLKEAQDNLSKLLEEAHGGRTVIILDETGQQVELVPLQVATKPRRAGSARGQIKIAPDFDQPLSDFDDYGIDHLY